VATARPGSQIVRGHQGARKKRFTLLDGDTLDAVTLCNQQSAPDDVWVDGTWWETIGAVFISNGTLPVQLSDDANGIVIADAMRAVKLE